MIIEGLLTTENEDGTLHIAPIGPHVDEELNQWMLKPFQTSTSFTNLFREGRGIFHVVDDALLLAVSVVGYATASFPRVSEQWMDSWINEIDRSRQSEYRKDLGWVLLQACQYYALQMEQWNTDEPRASVTCRVVVRQEQRPFWGWNRAKHSIVELAVMASRRHLLTHEKMLEELKYHRLIIEKTGGQKELAALEFLDEVILGTK